ncbi:XRE family transcriptional regulator [Burkholderia multivorans]|uniref:helix-turn-helix domain-containing protein n=1 Tax=Burkholderia multivorans TaxID=87883 RepID=UPI000CFE3B32|nr:helix-turn-helix transcriptional regulator [Burkholderia multivorans]AYY98406.1 XRE family transcriptional regulator [Burkholderia multivorans]MBU9120519.1 helix-turn-helix domain-containing protein [Burkholderia multivorans]PRF46560.1 transcriptional regulator [Burkholderia multivorans]PRG56250.1 transcriptional regulator [Burkholderia multivorans]PRG79239.1 transcriptional regulator [Burkholderia multivorans]
MDEQERAALVRAIGQAIASRRAVAGLSQERVAEALGITREAVSRMETGVAVPSVVRLAELAEIFDCTMEDLLTQASNRKLDQAATVVELLGRLTDGKREMLMRVIKELAEGLVDR